MKTNMLVTSREIASFLGRNHAALRKTYYPSSKNPKLDKAAMLRSFELATFFNKLDVTDEELKLIVKFVGDLKSGIKDRI